MSKKAERRDVRIKAAKERDTSLFASGAGDTAAIEQLRQLDGVKLGKLLQSSKLNARPMSPTRAVSLRILGAAQALVHERQAARAVAGPEQAAG
jgi:hypothetical protein